MSVTHGQRVIAGRYRLITVIGSGGAGVVWRARDDLLDRDVAVKEMARLAGADERTRSEAYTRTLREARAAARISHPGVAAVYDVVSEDDYPYIVMELIGGRPLSGLIADERPLPPRAAADIGRQVLAALLAGHAAGVLHRDLKPANVLITPDGRAVLTDFGIASVVGDPSITRTGVVVGTPGYLAPERIRGEPATPAADLWSLGATLYAAACGRGPYDGYDGAIATMYAVVSENPPEPTVGGPLRDIIDALLSRDPRLRPGPAEIALALDAVVGPRADDASGISGPHAEYAPYDEPRWEHVASESVGEPVAGAPMAAPVAGPPLPGQPLPGQPLPEPPRTVTSDLPPVRTPTEGASLLLEPPADAPHAGRAGHVAATDYLPSVEYDAGGDYDAGDYHAGDYDAGAARPRRSTRPRSPRSPWPVRRGSGNRRKGVLVGGVAAAAVAAAVVLTISLSHAKAPGAGSAANVTVTVPPVTEQFRVAAARNPDGSTELIARAQIGALMQDRLANGSRSGWIPLPGGLDFAGVPALATGADGRLVVFARTKAGNLVVLWQTAPGSPQWNAPKQLGSMAVTSDPTAVTWPDGHLEVFVRLGDGTLGAATQLSAARFADWSGWATLGGHLGSAPVAALNAGGRPEIFAIGSDHSMVHDYWLNGGWAGLSTLPGGQAFTGVPSVGRDSDGRLEVFARTSSGTIENIWQNSVGAGPWEGPATIPISNPVSDPAVMSVNGGRLELFAVVANGVMQHTWQKAPNGTTGWNAPASLRGNAVDAPAVIRVNGISELFAKGPDGKMGYDHLDHPVGAWSGWSRLDGAF